MVALRLAEIMPKELKEKLRNIPLLKEIKGVIGFEADFMRERGLIPKDWELYNFFFTYGINYIVFRLNDKEFLCRSLSMDEWEVNGIKVSSRAIGNLLENWLSV